MLRVTEQKYGPVGLLKLYRDRANARESEARAAGERKIAALKENLTKVRDLKVEELKRQVSARKIQRRFRAHAHEDEQDAKGKAISGFGPASCSNSPDLRMLQSHPFHSRHGDVCLAMLRPLASIAARSTRICETGARRRTVCDSRIAAGQSQAVWISP